MSQRSQTGEQWWIYRVSGTTGRRTPVRGTYSTSYDEAMELRHQMRSQLPKGSSTWFTLPQLATS